MVGAGVDAADAPSYGSHNDYATTVLLAEMFAAGCQRLVLASSMVVYGQGRYSCAEHGVVDPLPRTRADLDAGVFEHRCPIGGEELAWQLVDEDAPLRPRSLYAASKVAQENYALAWAEATGGSVVALRYHNVYGPNMPRDTPYSGVAAIFRSQLEAGDVPRVFEDGGQMRDFVHVDDVAAANVAAVEANRDGFTAVNVCSGRPISILEVANRVVRGTRVTLPPLVTGQYRSGDVRHIVASPAGAAELLGFQRGHRPARRSAGVRVRAAAGLTSALSEPLRAKDGAKRFAVLAFARLGDLSASTACEGEASMAGKHRKTSRPAAVVAMVVAPAGLAAAAMARHQRDDRCRHGETTTAAAAAVGRPDGTDHARQLDVADLRGYDVLRHELCEHALYGPQQVVPFLAGPTASRTLLAMRMTARRLRPTEPSSWPLVGVPARPAPRWDQGCRRPTRR